MGLSDLYRLDPYEIAAGWIFGSSGPATGLPGDSRTPRQALEDIILTSLQREPCGVSFSGGRDSSLVLSVATHVARREGLREPIPFTLRYPEARDTIEDEWQELVVRHLDLTDWERREIHDELDLVGPYATAMLRQHGPVWPAMTVSMIPALEAMQGGSLLSGEGGDEVLGHSEHRVQPIASAVRSPRPFQRWRYRPVLGAIAPRLARIWWAQRQTDDYPWLTEDALAWLREGIRRETEAEALHWPASVRSIAGQRSATVAEHTREIVALGYDVVASSPLLHAEFVDALARESGWMGPGTRADVIRSIAGDLLPDEIIDRTSKAEFSEGFIARHSTEFAQTWDGRGVDSNLVDAERLRAEWLSDTPSSATALLIQTAWLASCDDGE